MATPRAVKIPRTRSTPATSPASDSPVPPAATPSSPTERRENTGGSQRVVRLTVLFVVVLASMYAGFLLYDRTAPGGTSPAADNGVLLFSGVFALFAVVGVVYTLTAAPRAVVIGSDRVTVVGRWGRRRKFPPIDRMVVRVVRRYPEGFLAVVPVELVEVSGEDAPVRSYLVSAGLFDGAAGSRGSAD